MRNSVNFTISKTDLVFCFRLFYHKNSRQLSKILPSQLKVTEGPNELSFIGRWSLKKNIFQETAMTAPTKSWRATLWTLFLSPWFPAPASPWSPRPTAWTTWWQLRWRAVEGQRRVEELEELEEWEVSNLQQHNPQLFLVKSSPPPQMRHSRRRLLHKLKTCKLQQWA